MDYANPIIGLEEEIAKRQAEFEKEISPLQAAVDALKNINTVCLRCKGTGKIKKPDAAGQLETVDCPACR